MAAVKIRHGVIIGLSVVQQLISMAWYSPYLFGFDWIVAAEVALSSLPPAGSLGFYGLFALSLLASLVLCYAVVGLWPRLGITTAWRGVKIATLGWLIGPFLFTLTHHQFADAPWTLTWIDTARDWIVFASSGGVLAKWGYTHV